MNEKLDFNSAKESPCLSCSALCCKILGIDNFVLRSLADVDKLGYYLNFSGIEVLFFPDGNVSVYYSRPCRFLQAENSTCAIHNMPEQPSLCVHYSPYTCFYARADADKEAIRSGNIWMNRERLDILRSKLVFDKYRVISGVPSQQELLETLGAVPYTGFHESLVPPSAEGEQESLPELCHTCGACCSGLYFPAHSPKDAGNLDFIKYALGFPGVEYIITENDWVLHIPVRCRYLEGKNRCSVYGGEERPLYCRYLDPCKCSVKQVAGCPDYIHVNRETYPQIRELIRVGKEGFITGKPGLDALRKFRNR